MADNHLLTAKNGDVKDKTTFVVARVKGQKNPSLDHMLDIVR